MARTFDTHEVSNQPPSFEDVNLFTSDAGLGEAVQREGGAAGLTALAGFGLVCGSAAALEHGRLANLYPPALATHDRFGRRIDRVDYHPSYHASMVASFAEGLHSSVWGHLAHGSGGSERPGAHVLRAAGLYLAAQMETGHCCPLTMTNAAVAMLGEAPDLLAPLLPKLLSRTYDPANLPIADKSSVTIGMGLTEKQGGTDVRANTTRAEPVDAGGSGREYRLTGHKWFLSAPMSDAFIILAQTDAGPSAFLVPRLADDGTPNGLRLQRLKNKLGNRSNASAEVEITGAIGRLIGEDGRGIASVIDMITYTRLDCAVVSAGIMRFAAASAIHHAEHRSVFGKALAGQAVMREVLADLAIESEAAMALSFRLARSFDKATDQRAAAWRRIMTPVTKYWVCKIAPIAIAEAMECHGGNGYVEDAPLARLYREAPVNAIWEGSGNVMALDVLRVLQREPEAVEIVMEELRQASAGDRHLMAAHERVETILQDPRQLDRRARWLAEALAVLASGTILRAHAPAAVADAFIATRLGNYPRQTYGVGLDWADTRAILSRASPNQG